MIHEGSARCKGVRTHAPPTHRKRRTLPALIARPAPPSPLGEARPPHPRIRKAKNTSTEPCQVGRHCLRKAAISAESKSSRLPRPKGGRELRPRVRVHSSAARALWRLNSGTAMPWSSGSPVTKGLGIELSKTPPEHIGEADEASQTWLVKIPREGRTHNVAQTCCLALLRITWRLW